MKDFMFAICILVNYGRAIAFSVWGFYEKMIHDDILRVEQIEDLQRNGLRIIQSSRLPKFNADSIFLGNFPIVKNNWRVCDLCTGTGIIPLLLSTRASGLEISAIDINTDLVQMAKRSIQLNNLEKQIRVFEADVRDPSLPRNYFELVTVNPPYFTRGQGVVSKDNARANARYQLELTLDDVVNMGYELLLDKGILAMVYRASHIADVLASLTKAKFAITRLRFIHHSALKKASSCLVEAQKGAKRQTLVEPPLIIFQEDGVLTQEVRGVYYNGNSLESRA